jgi:hypothetical protein
MKPTKRQSGRKMEELCLEELKPYIKEISGYVSIAEWRSIPTKFANQDFMGFDFGIMFKDNRTESRYLCLVQVKSAWKESTRRNMHAIWGKGPHELIDVVRFIAVYGPRPRAFRENGLDIKLPHFWLVRV